MKYTSFPNTYKKPRTNIPSRFKHAAMLYERARTSLGVFNKRRKISPQKLFHDPQFSGVVQNIERNLDHLFTHLRIDEAQTREMAEETISICRQKTPLSEIEKQLRELYIRRGLAKKIDQSLLRRSEKIFQQIKGFVTGYRVLDIGAGDGKVGELIQKRLGKRVEGCDVVDYNKSTIPVRIYKEGAELPFNDGHFDTSLVLTVFHHSDNPLRLLREAGRVTSKRLIVIESIYMTEEHRKMNIFLDWFYNRVLHEGIPVPYNFQHPNQWETTFRRHGWNIKESIDLGIDQPTVPEHHWLFVLDKK